MSFNRLNYDTGTYKQDLNQSIGPGVYALKKPPVKNQCRIHNDAIKIQSCSGYNHDKIIDIDSELLGLNRRCSRNPSKQYQPSSINLVCKGIETKHINQHIRLVDDCVTQSEDTRLSNPPCTMRETEINRFDWLSTNPQDQIEIPFTHNISNRILVKDNHRPIIPNPISSIPLLPKQTGICSEKIKDVYANNTDPQSTIWKCQNITSSC